MQGVSFTLEDNKALLDQARSDAYADAKAKADQYGRLSGRGLGEAQAVNETVEANPQRFAMAGAAVSDSTATTTPISPGQVSTDVTITVRFALG